MVVWLSLLKDDSVEESITVWQTVQVRWKEENFIMNKGARHIFSSISHLTFAKSACSVPLSLSEVKMVGIIYVKNLTWCCNADLGWPKLKWHISQIGFTCLFHCGFLTSELLQYKNNFLLLKLCTCKNKKNRVHSRNELFFIIHTYSVYAYYA